MNDPLDNAPAPDDRPPFPAGEPQALVVRRAPGRTGRLVRWWLGISFLLVVACVVCLVAGMNQFDFTPLHIVIDGDDVTNGVTINGVTEGARILLAIGVVMLALLLLLLIPMVILLVIGAFAIALVAGLGLPLVALALAFLVISSPLWFIGLVAWLIVRRRNSLHHVPSARMAA
jgi:hypothetical protein